MRSLRVASFFVFVLAVAAVADAQCLKCYRVPGGPITKGTCGESLDNYCDRQCCGNEIGAPCSRPDFIDPCGGWLTASLLQRPALDAGPQVPYFVTRQPLENRTTTMHRRLQKLDPDAPKCGART